MSIAPSLLSRLKNRDLVREAALIGGAWHAASERNETFKGSIVSVPRPTPTKFTYLHRADDGITTLPLPSRVH